MKKLLKAVLVAVMALSSSIIYIPNQTINVYASSFYKDFTYELNEDGTVKITNYNGHDTQVVIPSEIEGKKVTTIGYGAFAECSGIEEVVFPETIKTIDDWAFSKCINLKSITLPDSIVGLDRNVFSGCHKLESVKLPKTLKSIPYGTFYECKNLKDIIFPDSLEYIDGLAFSGCKSLVDLDIQNTVKSIGGSAFSNCTSLVDIALPNSIRNIGAGVFSGCINLKNIILPDSLEVVGQYSFRDCISLESIYLPDSIVGIGYGSFTGCSSLKHVNIPKNLNLLSDALFSGCSNLEEIYIPDNITDLGSNVFSGCIKLSSISLPDSITVMGHDVFSFCSTLKEVKLPVNLKELGYSTFKNCYSLETIVLPAKLTKIDNTAFASCVSLKSLALPNSVTEIGSRVFSGSNNVTLIVGEGSTGYKYAVNNKVAYEFYKDGINLNASHLDMKKGTSFQLTGIMYPNYQVIKADSLVWKSSNSDIVEVNKDGVVVAKNVGTATITVENKSNLKAECIITVNNIENPITSVKIISTENTNKINKGKAKQLRAEVGPSDTTDSRELKWSSSDNRIATVSSTGTITAREPGEAVITVETVNGIKDHYSIVVVSPIETVSLDKTGINLVKGESQTLRASINPSDTTDDKTLTWVSSNESVATVDQTGKVTAISKGSATITVKTTNNRSAACSVIVKEEEIILAEKVVLDKTDISLFTEESTQLKATVFPQEAVNQTLTWKSSDENVATVDQNGKVTAVKAGTATITVATSNGKTATCKVSVKDKIIDVISVILNKENLDLTVEETETLIATINPINATDQTLTWKSSDENVATVDQNGKVIAVKAGTATITVTTSNGKTAECQVKVKNRITKEGWIFENDYWYYYVNGEKQTGWLYESGRWYLLSSSGVMLTGWQKVNGYWYYFSDSGVMQSGWLNRSGTWYLLADSGYMLTGWQLVDGSWYYFNTSGVMHTGWLYESGRWYLLSSSGDMQTGWQKVNGYWYYFSDSGVMQSGWLNRSGRWYLLADSGYMLTGWQLVDGSWYYFNTSGVMHTGWLYESGRWYLLSSSGDMQTGWQYVDGSWYYLDSNGVLK